MNNNQGAEHFHGGLEEEEEEGEDEDVSELSAPGLLKSRIIRLTSEPHVGFGESDKQRITFSAHTFMSAEVLTLLYVVKADERQSRRAFRPTNCGWMRTTLPNAFRDETPFWMRAVGSRRVRIHSQDYLEGFIF